MSPPASAPFLTVVSAQNQHAALHSSLPGPLVLRPEALQRNGLHLTTRGAEPMAEPLADFIAATLFHHPTPEP